MSTSILHPAFTLRSCKWAAAPAATTMPFLLVLLPGALFLHFSTQRPRVCPLGFASGSVLRGSLVLFRSVSPYILPATRPASPAHFSHFSESLVCMHTMSTICCLPVLPSSWIYLSTFFYLDKSTLSPAVLRHCLCPSVSLLPGSLSETPTSPSHPSPCCPNQLPFQSQHASRCAFIPLGC